MSFMDIGSGLGSAIGGLLGNNAAKGDQAAAAEAMRQALEAWKNLKPEDQQKLLQEYQAGDSSVGSMDQSGQQAQLDALQHLQGIYNTPGLTAMDKVAQDQAMTAAAERERGQRGAIMQGMASRGQVGGGAELAAQLQAQQTGATAMHQAGSDAASAAQQRALQAMMESGQLGGQVNSQELAKAQAKDVMGRFNAAQRAGAYQQGWDENVQRAAGMSGAYTNQSGYYGNEAQRTRNVWTGAGQGIGGTIGGAADAYSGGGVGDWLNPTKKKG